MSVPRLLRLVALGVLGAVFAVQARGQDRAVTQLVDDEKFLQTHKVATDADGLLQYFRQQTLSKEERQTIQALVAQLASPVYKVREKAAVQLNELGTKALP